MPADHGLAPAPEDGAFTHRGVAAADRSAQIDASSARWAIILSRFNGGVVHDLYAGAVESLIGAGASSSSIEAFTVPGAVELPLLARELASGGRFAGVIALGCVIRGETTHYEYVCGAASDGLMRVQLDQGIPVGFGVLTCESLDQAQARSQRAPGGHNVGADAAAATVELANLLGHLRAT